LTNEREERMKLKKIEKEINETRFYCVPYGLYCYLAVEGKQFAKKFFSNYKWKKKVLRELEEEK